MQTTDVATTFLARLSEEANAAFLAAHPDRDPDSWNNDPIAVSWRHGYITAVRARMDQGTD